MGLRFRKSIKLAPGVRMNLSGSGISWSIGPRGASISIGKRGTYLNTGIPGTGLYSRQRLGYTDTKSSSNPPSKNTSISIQVVLTEDGTLNFIDSNGNALPQNLINSAKKQHADVIQDLILSKCDEINAQIEALGEIHLYTPNPNLKPQYQIQEFNEPEPNKPIPKKPGLFDKFFRQKVIEKDNQDKEIRYLEEFKTWQIKKQQFDESELIRKNFIEKEIYNNVEAMECFLEENLKSIIWPRETLVSTEILNNGSQIFIDVDLPEIEDMPNKKASVPQRGYKLSIKEMAPRQIQQLYMKHVHGIGFRIIGETFSALPNTQQITLSAYSQRLNTITAQITDEYLYSVQVDKNLWSRINFDNLQNLDIVEALTQFNIVRKMTKTGNFQPIRPLSLNI